jgi:8-oxo-dGTP pyrophosphatase MutT (NUDIX family)
MKEWVVAGAVIEGPDGLLLVQNLRRNGSLDWSTPGGVIDEGEHVLAGLAREVEEETGLQVTEWEGPLYEVETWAPAMGWHLRVEVHRALRFHGTLRVDDPDGIVVDARFVPIDGCDQHLDGCHPWVREPLVAWLADRAAPRVTHRYEVTERGITRLD